LVEYATDGQPDPYIPRGGGGDIHRGRISWGPRTALDIVIHLVMVIVLVVGLIITVRAPRTVSEQVTTGI